MSSGSRLRVILVGPDIEGTPGGMAEISRQILANFDEHESLEMAFVASHIEGSPLRKIVALVAAVLRLVLESRRSDVVHFQVASGASVPRKWILATIADACRLAVVVQVHGADTCEDYETSSFLQRLAYRRLFARARTVMVLGSSIHSWMQRTFPEVECVIMPNFAPLPSQISNLPDKASFLFVGRLGDRKGTWDLLNAFKEIATETDAQLVLAGDGEIGRARRFVDDQPELAERVSILGWVHHARLPDLLNESSALILPSYAEGLPMAIIEAMAHARPVIATKVGAVPDLVVDGQTGFLCDAGNVNDLKVAMAAIARNRALAESLGRMGRRLMVQRFSSEVVSARLLEVYSGLRTVR